MQVRTPRAWPRDDGEFTVEHNPGRGKPFTEISLSEDGLLKLVMQSVHDCDRLIKAAIASRDLLIEHAGDKDKPHAWRATAGNPCLVCGQPKDGHPDPDAAQPKPLFTPASDAAIEHIRHVTQEATCDDPACPLDYPHDKHEQDGEGGASRG